MSENMNPPEGNENMNPMEAGAPEEGNELQVGYPIDLYDENGDSLRFDHLDTIELESKKYVVLTPFVAEDEEPAEEEDVYIMHVIETEDKQNVLEMVEDDAELDRVFAEFKNRMKDQYDFLD